MMVNDYVSCTCDQVIYDYANHSPKTNITLICAVDAGIINFRSLGLGKKDLVLAYSNQGLSMVARVCPYTVMYHK